MVLLPLFSFVFKAVVTSVVFAFNANAVVTSAVFAFNDKPGTVGNAAFPPKSPAN